MHLVQVIIYSIVQGITELFPISSVGHAVILPYLAGWTNISGSPQFLPFVVMLHLGTAIALLFYFWRDWADLLSSLYQKKPRQRRALGLIIAATIPAAIVGKLFEHKLQTLFPSAFSAALVLIVNGFVLFWADNLRRTEGSRRISEVTYPQAIFIGLIQCLALIPGFSRSGITMTAGLRVGLSYDDSARFSFLLATPVILGAGILEVPKMLKSASSSMLHLGLLGGLFAAVVAFLSTGFLMRHFSTHEVKALRPFGYYCVCAGAVVALCVATGVHF